MKKFNSFEEKLGMFISEYTSYVYAGITPSDAYHDPDTYPFFRRMCDAIVHDIMCADVNYVDGNACLYPNTGACLHNNVCELMLDTLGDEIDCICVGPAKGVYDTCAEYARIAQKHVCDIFKLYMR